MDTEKEGCLHCANRKEWLKNCVTGEEKVMCGLTNELMGVNDWCPDWEPRMETGLCYKV